MINSYQLLIERIKIIKEALPRFDMIDQNVVNKNNETLSKLIKEVEYYKNASKVAFEQKLNESFIKKEIIDKKDIEEYEQLCNLILKDIYEQININEYLYNIKNPESIQIVNDNIGNLLELFKKININLTKDDFTYDINVYKYMETYFSSNSKDDLKQEFDELYWKNYNLLQDLEINFRLLIEKNINLFKKYTDELLNNLLQKLNINKDQLINEYFNKLINYDNIYYHNKGIVYDLFLSEKLKIDNFLNIDEVMKKFIDIEKYNELDNKNEILNNIVELSYNLEEYQNYNKYQDIIKKINELFTKKDSFKNTLATKLKGIDKLLKEHDKLNKIINKLSCNLENSRKKVNEKNIIKLQSKLNIELDKINKINENIREEYKTLDQTKFEELYSSILNENTTIYEAFLELLNYSYMLKEYNIDLKEFKKFVYNPYNKIIYNLTITSNEKIQEIIENKYRLLNYELDINDITIDDLYNSSLIIRYYNYFIKGNIDFNIIKVLCDNKELLKENE